MTLMDAGRVVRTHGVHGDVRVEPWCDSPAFLADFTHLYLNDEPYKVQHIREHKRFVLVKLDGVDDIGAAMALVGKMVRIDRDAVTLPEGRVFIQDLLGLTVMDEATGQAVGILTDVLPLPAHDVYVVRDGDKETLIPAVPAFLGELDWDKRIRWVRRIEGM